MEFPSHLPIPDEVLKIAKRLEQAGFETWCVGGAIRDNLLGVENHDFDLTTAAPPQEVQRLFKRTLPLPRAHRSAALLRAAHRSHQCTTSTKNTRTHRPPPLTESC